MTMTLRRRCPNGSTAAHTTRTCRRASHTGAEQFLGTSVLPARPWL